MDDDLKPLQHRFTLSAQPGTTAQTAPGRFDILAITAGEGNGWRFSEAVLRDSLPLWDGAETFVDHAAGAGDARSVRDLGGVCRKPRWDDAARGIRLELHTLGPSGPLVESLGREWLSAGAVAAEPAAAGASGSENSRARLGFSADVIFTAKGREVQRIARVLSLDLVFNPARGGAFIRALNSTGARQPQPPDGGRARMEPTFDRTETTQPQDPNPALSLCAGLLESTLAASRLPAPSARRIREAFAGRVFEPGELNAAVDDARALAAELQAAANIRGPAAGSPRITEMTTGEERLQAAVDDLLGAPRDPGAEALRPERLSGIRELYLTLTGDSALTGAFNPARARLATTLTMPNLVKNTLNKMIVRAWDEMASAGYAWWEPVVQVEHFDRLQQVTGVLVGEVEALPTVAEAGAYTALDINDSAETGDWVKYGGYLPLTLELIDRDDLTRLRSYPRKLANAALRNISGLVASVFTANAGIGPVMADGKNVFEAAAHKNLGSAALTAAEWEKASQAVYAQELLTGGATKAKLAVDPRYLLVPRGLRLTAQRILYPSWEREANLVSENLQRGQSGDVVVVPEWTDANDWAAVCDPRRAPAVVIAERFGIKPEIFIAGDEHSPALFANDELRIKVRHFLSVFVADYRPLYKSNVV